uniref:sulfate ABC transporter protein n=1 Tax=Galdieria phlegrea TaxID=1389228 RepID=UPI0023D83097|nr:sulfate ABC transporter protein [Galdieria phlegrea]WDA99811.1 sulfate ABC transporter protein [Galdieria phlegrea]
MKIILEKICKFYKKKCILNNLHITFSQYEILGLLGPNGTGKTSIFRIITGITKPNSGVIWLNGENITNVPMHQRARLGICYLPQESSVFRKLTVKDNLKIALEELDLNEKQQNNIIESFTFDFQLDKALNTFGSNISGGEKRKLEIARAVIIKPKFLLLDEPFAGIDPISISELQKIIITLNKAGIGILITDHNVRETLKITHRSYILSGSNILASGTTRQLLDNKEVRSSYLGNDFVL